MCVLGTNQNLNSESDFKLLHLGQENSSFCSPVSAGIEWWIWILSASKSSSEKFREQGRGLGRWVSYQHARCVNMRTWIWTEGMAVYTCNPSSEGGGQSGGSLGLAGPLSSWVGELQVERKTYSKTDEMERRERRCLALTSGPHMDVCTHACASCHPQTHMNMCTLKDHEYTQRKRKSKGNHLPHYLEYDRYLTQLLHDYNELKNKYR